MCQCSFGGDSLVGVVGEHLAQEVQGERVGVREGFVEWDSLPLGEGSLVVLEQGDAGPHGLGGSPQSSEGV